MSRLQAPALFTTPLTNATSRINFNEAISTTLCLFLSIFFFISKYYLPPCGTEEPIHNNFVGNEDIIISYPWFITM